MTRPPMITLPPEVAAAYRARERDARELARTAEALASMKKRRRPASARLARPLPRCISELLPVPRGR